MGSYDDYSENEFESFETRKKSKRKFKKKKKLFKKVKKFFRKLGSRVIDTALSTIAQMALRLFDKKFKTAFA